MVSELVEVQTESLRLGSIFKLPRHEVERIKEMNSDPRDKLMEVIISFTRRAEPEPTWEHIVLALENPLINRTALAKRLRDKYLQRSSSQHSEASFTPTGMNSTIELLHYLYTYALLHS